MFFGISMSRKLDITALDLPVLQHMAEGKMCVHSFYVENCSGCRVRELERHLAILIDVNDENFTPDVPLHGFTFPSRQAVWDSAKAALKRAEEGD